VANRTIQEITNCRQRLEKSFFREKTPVTFMPWIRWGVWGNSGKYPRRKFQNSRNQRHKLHDGPIEFPQGAGRFTQNSQRLNRDFYPQGRRKNAASSEEFRPLELAAKRDEIAQLRLNLSLINRQSTEELALLTISELRC
jgi:hypothetical protein